MLDFLVKNKGLTRDNAYMLASAAMDLIVTQAVDGTKGIHAMMPKGIFRKWQRPRLFVNRSSTCRSFTAASFSCYIRQPSAPG
jgi:hypothetical protein